MEADDRRVLEDERLPFGEAPCSMIVCRESRWRCLFLRVPFCVGSQKGIQMKPARSRFCVFFFFLGGDSGFLYFETNMSHSPVGPKG